MSFSDQECLCRIVPGQPLARLQQPSPTAPRKWDAHSINQAHQTYGPSGALEASYPTSYVDPSQTGFVQAAGPNPPHHTPFDQNPPNNILQDPYGPPSYATAVQHPNVAANTLGTQPDIGAMTVTSHSEGFYIPQEQPKASCCSSKKSSHEQSASQDANRDTASGLLNGSPQTTMYRIPAGLATYSNPLKPERQAELEQSTPDYMQTVLAHAESGVIGVAALPAETNDTSNHIMATTHVCRCGASCECMACPVHPANATTKARVADLYEIIDNEPPLPPSMDESSSWPVSHGHVGAMASTIDQTFVHSMPSREHVLLQPSDYVPHQLEDHWVPLIWSPDFSASGSESSIASFPRTMLNGGLTSAFHHGSNHAAPSQNYLHFQFPVPYTDGQ